MSSIAHYRAHHSLVPIALRCFVSMAQLICLVSPILFAFACCVLLLTCQITNPGYCIGAICIIIALVKPSLLEM